MDAWIDCMSYIDESDAGMTNPSVEKGGLVVIKVDEAAEFAKQPRAIFGVAGVRRLCQLPARQTR
jgi:hypothetical protein